MIFLHNEGFWFQFFITFIIIVAPVAASLIQSNLHCLRWRGEDRVSILWITICDSRVSCSRKKKQCGYSVAIWQSSLYLVLESGLETSSWSQSWSMTRTLRTRPETRLKNAVLTFSTGSWQYFDFIVKIKEKLYWLWYKHIYWTYVRQLVLFKPPFYLS